MKMQTKKWLVLLFTVLLMAGCSTVPDKEGEGADVGDPNGEGADVRGLEGEGANVGSLEGGGAATMGAGGQRDWSGAALDDPNSPLSNRTIYFEYDSSDISPEYVDVLRAHGQYLAANPSVTMVLEGHCDERGTREYNLALGEQRAHRAKQIIMAEGVSNMQVSEISYGEEKSEGFGQDESTWARNRRVEIIY